MTASAQTTMAQNNTPRPKLNHLAILTTDLKKSTDFYQNIIGLEIAEEPFKDGRHTWFSLGGGAHLHIIQELDSKDNHRKNNHLCFAVPSVEAFAKKLNEAKIKFENVPGVVGAITTRTDGVKQIYFQDPDGYWIEINDAK
ncbi:VOC family protein [Mucilaginibacter myungsuensis]